VAALGGGFSDRPVLILHSADVPDAVAHMDRVALLGPATCVPGELAAPAGGAPRQSAFHLTRARSNHAPRVMVRPDDVPGRPGHLTHRHFRHGSRLHATACLADA